MIDDLGESVRRTLAKAVVDLLNDALQKDPDAIGRLFSHRVEVNEALAMHPTVQVRKHSGSRDATCPDCGLESEHDKECIRAGSLPPYHDIYIMGLLGLINGVVGPDRRGRRGYVTMVPGKKKDSIERFQLQDL